MQILLTLDKKDYEEGMPVFEKYSTRGVIIRDGKIATQHGSAGDYKILGGGVEPGEKLEDALIREVGEESGLIVIPESIRPIGEIVERRRDLFEKNKIYVGNRTGDYRWERTILCDAAMEFPGSGIC